jgi:hypothetical protein
LIKLLVKLALAALIANAAWRLGSAYVTFYKFKDAVTETAQFGAQKSSAELQQRILELASQYEIPIAADAVSVQRGQQNRTVIDGSYAQPVDLLPGYRYLWPFTWHIEVFTLNAPRAEPSGGL